MRIKKRIILFPGIIFILLCSTSMIACSNAKGQNTVSFTHEVTSTQNTPYSHWWEKFNQPQYGGTLKIAASGLENVTFSPNAAGQTQLWMETLFAPDWNINRSIWSFRENFIPVDCFAGLLAADWEQTDPTTVTVHLRKGIHWWNRYPVNGRELTAADVQYNYDLALKGGYKLYGQVPVPGMNDPVNLKDIESVTATDAYTIVFKLKKINENTLQEVFTGISIAPPEIIKLDQQPVPPAPPETTPMDTTVTGTSTAATIPFSDVQEVIGTGPWIPSYYARSSSLTYVANPDYWGHDEHYSQNKLPYLNEIQYFSVLDPMTLEASLRTGKIDLDPDPQAISWQQAKKLLQTNPTIQIAWIQNAGYDLEMKVNSSPFNDIRVREALNMAVDRKAIANSIYGGAVDGTPCGLVSPVYRGYAFDYSQWPDSLKEIYSYNPTGAKQLLAEAGFSSLKTDCMVSQMTSLDILQILQYEFKQIGVQMDINRVDQDRYPFLIASGDFDQMCLDRRTGMVDDPYDDLAGRMSTAKTNYTFHTDTSYDDIVNRLAAATTVTQAKQLSTAADRYALEQCWTVNVCPTASPVIWQSHLKGYSGESLNPYYGYYYARWWIAPKLTNH